MIQECRIQVLPEEVASKIAAGEVVERPASVVKELAENSVDAGATRLTVEVEEGGRRLIRVTDNGCGMTAQEAVLALQRHATSKIRSEEDLLRIRSLGFRGEALPSVASVSRVTIITRPRGAVEGTRLEVEGGEIRSLDAAGAPEGTSVTVRDLFYNTPARLKFLKMPRTELGQACDALSRIALAQPHITIRLLADGDEVLYCPATDDLRNAVAAVFGPEVARDLLPVAWEKPGLRVEGLVAKPTGTRPTRSGQLFFVNGRFVRGKVLTHALDEAYRATLPTGRFPVAVLRLEIDPTLVDVNVHPTKTEVRFLREWEVHRALHEAVQGALGAHGGGSVTPSLARQAVLPAADLFQRPWVVPTSERPLVEAAGASGVAGVVSVVPAPVQPSIPDLHPPLAGLRPIAQVWQSYILAEGPTGLLIIDQHLAHERVLFDRLAAREGEVAAQRLAVPITLQVTHREALLVDDLLPELAALGFEIEPFGRDAFVVRAAPALLPVGQELVALKGLLDELAHARQTERRAVPREHVIATTACQAAIKKGTRLALEEMRQLLDDLESAALAHTCPHGCPIAVEISYQELLRRFKRT
ncbi:MAG: DNA mismatch repair endonuclease MutL [Armatimonadetes bacterium]|nr:DNA mismatch repair endonuclease MutL [Armatimonadota bacterium]